MEIDRERESFHEVSCWAKFEGDECLGFSSLAVSIQQLKHVNYI